MFKRIPRTITAAALLAAASTGLGLARIGAQLGFHRFR